SGTAPPSPFPTAPPFPPQLNLKSGFAQPFWSIPQNWVNGYVPQNGDDIVFPYANDPRLPPGTVIQKGILPLVNNAFQTFGALAHYNSIDDIPSLTTIGSITVEDDGFRIGYDFNTGVPDFPNQGFLYRGANGITGPGGTGVNNTA